MVPDLQAVVLRRRQDREQVDILMADKVEEILPKLRAAAARVAEAQKDLAPEVAQKL